MFPCFGFLFNCLFLGVLRRIKGVKEFSWAGKFVGEGGLLKVIFAYTTHDMEVILR